MKPEDVYVSPNDEVFVTNFTAYYTDNVACWWCSRDEELLETQYRLEVGKWYKLGQKAIAPNADDFIDVIHGDGKSIPHDPEHFMTKSEWREKQLNQIL